MERKEHDLMMNIVANPEFSLSDFTTVGLNINNTSLQDESAYRNHPIIQQIFTDNTGKFNEKQFKDTYNSALISWNKMSNDQFKQQQQAIFDRNNIDAPLELRNWNPNFKQKLVANPQKITESIFRLGEYGPRTKSDDELAQANKVLLNPNEVYKNGNTDWSKAKWGDSPNDSFWGYFTDTLVMAQWDEDGTHVDPITGETVMHQKGELKIGVDGGYYYEKLDGRDVYGKRVLNKMNVITTDGSTLNKYDFFDSDDIDQNVGKTLLKNSVLVGSMFIPYVGPAIVGANILAQLVGITGVLGKMFLGSESPTLSAMEGWSKSMNRQTARSEYAQQNNWCWENFINVIGDAAAQITEQRFLFTKLPALFKGSTVTEAGINAKRSKYLKEVDEFANLKLGDLAKNGLTDAKIASIYKEGLTNKDIRKVMAEQMLNDWQKSYYKIGEIASKGYMTAITVQDTYGEAKEAGASDVEATMLTLGYGAAEAWLLNTGIGEWMMPELRQERIMARRAAKTLTEPIRETLKTVRKEAGKITNETSKEAKQNFALKLFNAGKNLFNATYFDKALEGGSKLGTLGGMMLASGIGEGVEEVSEEFLKDFAYGAFNTVNWLRGDDTRLSSFGFTRQNDEWTWSGKDLWDRYGMSLIGGFFGGMVAAPGQGFKTVMGKMNSESARQQIVYLAREGKLDLVRKELNNIITGDKNLSAYQFDEIGDITVAKPGTKEDNQDFYVKKVFNDYLNFVENTLNSQGSNLSDDSFLAKVLGDLKYNSLYQSETATRLLQDFNSLNSKILKVVSELNELETKALDKNKNNKIEDPELRSEPDPNVEEDIKKKKSELKELQKQLETILSGENSDRYIGEMLFEMIPELHTNIVDVTKPLYIKTHYNGKSYDQLSNVEKNEVDSKFEGFKNFDKAQKIHYAANALMDMLKVFSPSLKTQESTYKNYNQKLQQVAINLTNIYKKINSGVLDIENAATYLNTASVKNEIAEAMNPETYAEIDIEYLTKQAEINSNESLSPNDKELQLATLKNEFQAKVDSLIDNVFQDFVDQGFVNNDVKRLLLPILNKIHTETQIDYQDALEEGADDSVLTELEEKEIQTKELVNKFKNLPNTPWEQNLDEFAISTGQNPIKFTQLLDKINRIIESSKDDLSLIDLSDQLISEISNAVKTINLYQAAIHASKTDDINPYNIFGYTKTLNEVLQKIGKPAEYAEINTDFANILVQDLENAKQKLLFVEGLFNANNGNKKVLTEKIEKHVINLIVDKFRTIIQVPDDEYKELENVPEFIAFKQYIINTDNFKTIDSDKAPITKEEKKNFQKEIIQLFDSVYTFLNSDWAKDPNNLKLFINPSRFNPFQVEESPIFNLNLKSLADSTFLHLISALSAIKYSDYLSQYNTILNPDGEILPIFSQEIAAFIGYANALNNLKINNTINVYNNEVINTFRNSDSAQRAKYLEQLKADPNTALEYAKDENVEKSLSLLKLVKYDTIELVEGIAGSGKTSVVFGIINQLLKKYNKNLHDGSWVIHGSDQNRVNQGSKLVENLAIENGKALSVEEYFNLICPEYSKLNEDDFYELKDGRINSTLGINTNIQDYPSFLFFDEIGKFNRLQLSLMDKANKYYGAVTMAAGDFDQTKNILKLHPEVNGIPSTLYFTSARRDFIHSPKIGSSMRTDNTVKTSNNNKYQFWKNNESKDKGELQFQYFIDEKGELFGDLIVDTQIKNTYIQKAVDQVKVWIDNMEDPEEKITFISQGKNELYKALMAIPGAVQRLDIVSESEAQGMEQRYYIIETKTTSDDLLKDLDTTHDVIYTGVTRAKQGSLLICPKDILKFNNKKVEEMVPERTQQYVHGAVTTKKEILSELIPNVAQIQPNIRQRQTINQPTTNQPSTQSTTNNQSNTIQSTPSTIPSSNFQPTSPIPKVLTQEEIRAKYGNINSIQKLSFQYENDNYTIDLYPIKIESETEILNSPIFKYTTENGNISQIVMLKIGDTLMPWKYDGNTWLPLVDYKEGSTQTNNVDSFNNAIENALRNTITISQDIPELTDLSIFDNIPTDSVEFANWKSNIIRSELPKNKLTPPNAKYQIGDNVEILNNNSIYEVIDFTINSNNEIEYILKDIESNIARTIQINESEINPNYSQKTEHIEEFPFNINDVVIWNNQPNKQFKINRMWNIIENGIIKDYDIELINTKDSTNVYYINQENFKDIKIFEEESSIPDQTIAAIFQDSDNYGLDPIVETDHIDYSNKLNNANEPVKKMNINVQSNGDNPVTFGMLLYSFNTLELGSAKYNEQTGKFEDDTQRNSRDEEVNMSKLRIDSVNGLRKIRDLVGLNGTYNQKLKWRQQGQQEKEFFKRKLIDIRNVIMKTPEKTNILQKLEDILGYKASFINFAFKASPVFTGTNKEYVAFDSLKSKGKYGYNINEKSQDNLSKGDRSDEIIPHKLVATIGTTKDGEILEIPLFSLSNPVTIMYQKDQNGNYPFQEMINAWENYPLEWSFAKKIDDGILAEFSNNPKYKNLINLFRLFRHDMTGFARINFGNNEWANWTPAKYFKDLGLRPLSQAGLYQVQVGFEMNEQNSSEIGTSDITDYIPITELLTKQVFNISSKILVTMDTMGGKYKKGNSFVLVGDPDLSTDEDLIDYFLAQQNIGSEENLHPKVSLLYVLPPISNFYDYIQHIQNKLEDLKPESRNIGHFFTPFQILDKIINGESVTAKRLQNKFKDIYKFDNPNIIEEIKGYLNPILEIYNNENISKEQRTQLTKEALYKEIKYEDQKYKAITLLTKFLINLAEDRSRLSDADRLSNKLITSGDYNIEVTNLIDQLLKEENYTIYYRGNKITDSSPTLGGTNSPFIVVNQDSDYTINEKPFMINGKIDTSTFSLENDCSRLIEHILDRIDKDFYINPSTEEIVSLNNSSQLILKNTNKVKNLIDQNLYDNIINNYSNPTKTSNEKADRNLVSINNSLMNQIRVNHPKKIVFSLNNEIFVSDDLQDFVNPIAYTLNGELVQNQIIDSLKNNSGIYEFEIYSGEDVFHVDYNSINKELVYYKKSKNEPTSEIIQTPTVSDQNLYTYKQDLLNSINDKIANSSNSREKAALSFLKTFLNKFSDQDSYTQALLTSTRMSEIIINNLSQFEDINQQNLINEIISFLKLNKDQRIIEQTSQEQQEDIHCNVNKSIRMN